MPIIIGVCGFPAALLECGGLRARSRSSQLARENSGLTLAKEGTSSHRSPIDGALEWRLLCEQLGF
jgi:hypothetical protein